MSRGRSCCKVCSLSIGRRWKKPKYESVWCRMSCVSKTTVDANTRWGDGLRLPLTALPGDRARPVTKALPVKPEERTFYKMTIQTAEKFSQKSYQTAVGFRKTGREGCKKSLWNLEETKLHLKWSKKFTNYSKRNVLYSFEQEQEFYTQKIAVVWKYNSEIYKNRQNLLSSLQYAVRGSQARTTIGFSILHNSSLKA